MASKAANFQALVVICALGAVACSSSDDRRPEATNRSADAAVARSATHSDAGSPAPMLLAAECGDDADAVYTLPTDLPEYDASHRGDVVRCASDRTLTMGDLQTALAVDGFADIEVRSSVRVYRVAYRTDRLVGQEGLTTALLFLPDRPIAEHPPVIVAGHGFNGIAAACRFSTQFALDGSSGSGMGMMLALAAYGYPLIAPDYPGWGAGSATTPGLSADEGHSLLDGTRAMRNLLAPGETSGLVVLVGHSEGGHGVLSAQAMAASYGLAGQLVAVVPIAPMWYPLRMVGAVISPAAGLTIADNAGPISMAMVYFHGYAEFYDGPGGGLRLYQPSKRDAMERFFDPTLPCYASTAEGPTVIKDALLQIGATTSDFFEPEFLDSVGACGIFGGAECETEPAATWIERFRADRPELDPHGAEVLLWMGGEDESAPPPLVQCGIDKVTADLTVAGASARLTVCGDRTADHGTVIGNNITWTARWIASRTLGMPAPDACPGSEALQPADGQPLACPAVPGNAD